MRDPLQSEQTPAEVLGIEPSASPDEIKKAFMAALARRVPANKAKAAFDALGDPVERAWHRLMQYRPEALSQLIPNILHDASALQCEKRRATASAWEQQFQTNFPDPWKAHSLAVLWYWWAVDHDRNLTANLEECADGRAGLAADLDVVWSKAIAYWSLLLETPEVWKDGLGLIPQQAEQLRKKIRETLRNRLLDQAQRFSAYGAVSAQYRKLELALTTELDSAKGVSEYGAKTAKGRIRAGVLMLRQMGLLDRIRGLVEESLQKAPGNGPLVKLQGLLSPYLPISVLIQNGKPDEALNEITNLSAKEQSLPEVSGLRVRALLLQGQHRASVGQSGNAIASWESALQTPSTPKELREKIEAEVIAHCHSRATSLQDKQQDEAIAVLELGLGLVTHAQKLKETLGELLTRRAVVACNEVQDKIKAARKQSLKAAQQTASALIPQFEQGIKDLQRASSLGSKRATENLATATDVLAALKNGTHVAFEAEMPPEVQHLQAKAKQAADNEDWSAAIGLLCDALKVLSDQDKWPIKRQLAVYLSNDAVGRANRAVEMLNKVGAERKRAIGLIWGELHSDPAYSGPYETLRIFQTPRCARCNHEISDAYFNVTTPAKHTRSICQQCWSDMKRRLDEASKPCKHSSQVLELLQYAEQQCLESLELDGNNQRASDNLAAIRETMSNCSIQSNKRCYKRATPGKSWWSFWN